MLYNWPLNSGTVKVFMCITWCVRGRKGHVHGLVTASLGIIYTHWEATIHTLYSKSKQLEIARLLCTSPGADWSIQSKCRFPWIGLSTTIPLSLIQVKLCTCANDDRNKVLVVFLMNLIVTYLFLLFVSWLPILEQLMINLSCTHSLYYTGNTSLADRVTFFLQIIGYLVKVIFQPAGSPRWRLRWATVETHTS